MILHKLFLTGVNTFTNTNLEMSVVTKRKERSVRMYVCSSQMVCYAIAAVARRDDKQRI